MAFLELFLFMLQFWLLPRNVCMGRSNCITGSNAAEPIKMIGNSFFFFGFIRNLVLKYVFILKNQHSFLEKFFWN